MDSNDPLKQEVLDVRKVIEKSTSKVSLRDLEKKGFRQVKVLRAGDINQLIFKAVQNVLAKQPRSGMSEEEKQKILREAKAEVDRQLADAKRMQAEANRLEQQKEQIEEANKKLQEKVEALNRQFLAEKKGLEKEKQNLYEVLQRAEARAEGTVPKAEYDRLRERFDRLQNDLEVAEEKARQAQAQAGSSAGVEELRAEIEARDARMQDLLTGLTSTLKQATLAAPAGSGEIPDLSKQFKALQVSLTDQIRKAAGGKGGDVDFEVTPEAIGAIFAHQGNVPMQANEVEIKETKATGVEDKLSKLKRMRGGK